jgi:hypothetical protein
MGQQQFDQYRRDVKRVLGGMPTKTPCVTCRTPESEIPKGSPIPDRKCLIRRCVDRTGVTNCAYCSLFPCDTLRRTAVWTRERIEAKLGGPISEEDYHACVEPFEGATRLQAIRASLKPDQIVDPAGVSASEARVAAFPEGLLFSREETESFRMLHDLLSAVIRSSLGLSDTDTFAQQNRLQRRKAHVLRFLWMLGRYGTFELAETPHLVIEAATYLANRGNEKALAGWAIVEDVIFKALAEFGVRCRRVPSQGAQEEDATTPAGYARKAGWVMTMSFEEKIGGAAALKALQSYTGRLDQRYGSRAFQRFSGADMQVLSE